MTPEEEGKQRRVSQACDACKRRKVRCNGQQRCQQCNHLDLKCVYSAGKRTAARRNTAERGAVIAEYRKNTTTSYSHISPAPLSPTAANSVPSPTSFPLPPISPHPHPQFFLDLIPDYLALVYPVNPVITEAEIRTCIQQMNNNMEAASFLYAFAAVTINLTRSDMVQYAPVVKDQIASLLNRCFECRDPMGLESQATLLKIMADVFVQICLMGLQKMRLGFFYLRQAISMLHMLRIENAVEMASLSPGERARNQRAYWECFIHERFTALTENTPVCLEPLESLPDHDPTLSPEIEQGWNLIIKTFMIIDREFIQLWNGDRSQVTSEFVERKHEELDDNQWQMEVNMLSAMQQADLIITRQWLRTLVWQLAMSNILLSSESKTESLTLTFPLRLSSQLRQFLTRMSLESVGIHGTGILSKLFEITDTIADVVIHLPQASTEDTLQRVDDILFLKRYIFSFTRIQNVQKRILIQKFEKMKEVYPDLEEIEHLVSSPLSLTSSAS